MLSSAVTALNQILAAQYNNLRTDLINVFQKRQGGSATNWATTGTNNYTPGVTPLVQTGSANVTPAGGFAVTFPTAFANVPIVFLQAEEYAVSACIAGAAPTTTGFTMRLWNMNSGVEYTGTAYWLAIGEAV